MTTLFLFGAGASFGNPAATPGPPPLGVALFDELARRFESARHIPPELAEIFRRNFETGMASFYDARTAEVPRFLRDMGAYFSEFAPLQGNYYEELGRIVHDAGHVGVYATLNYELLLELGLLNAGLNPVYGGESAKLHDGLVLKLHGSCNFLPVHRPPYADVRMENVSWVNWAGEELVGGAIQPANQQECRDYYQGRDARGPAMAIYMPGKRSLFSHEAITNQQQRWRREVRSASRIFTIGCRLVEDDDHIWGPLSNTKVPLFYVGFEPDDMTAWAHARRRQQISVLTSTFEEALPLIRQILRSARGRH